MNDQEFGPLTEAEVVDIETALSLRLVPEHREMLLSTGGYSGNRGILYSHGIIEMNIAHEVQKYLPGHYALGDDGGGRMFICIPPSSICYYTGMGALVPEWLRHVSDTIQGLRQLLVDDVLFDGENAMAWSAKKRLILTSMPPGGVRDLVLIHRLVESQQSIGVIRKSMSSTPVVIMSDVTLAKISGLVNRIGAWADYVSIVD